MVAVFLSLLSDPSRRSSGGSLRLDQDNLSSREHPVPAVRQRDISKGTPFRYPLRNEFPGRAGKLMRLAHDGRVVRVLHGWNDADVVSLNAYCQTLRRDGVRVPSYDVLRAPRWDRANKEAMYIVTESIIGERLDEIARPSELDWQLPVSKSFYQRLYHAIDEFVTTLLAHYTRILGEGGMVFSAMDQSQFLYGTTHNDRQPAVYFVDLDPTYKTVPALRDRAPMLNGDAKTEFEKPINILFEMQILHPEALLPCSEKAARQYFTDCALAFQDFYSAKTPWWARAPAFEQYQRMKARLVE